MNKFQPDAPNPYESRLSSDRKKSSYFYLNEIKEIVLRHFPDVVFDYIKERPDEVLETKADPNPLRALGWKTQIDIHHGINECFSKLKEELRAKR